jgi:hypothetical protein
MTPTDQPDERHTPPPTDSPDDPGTPQEDTMSTTGDTGTTPAQSPPAATAPGTPAPDAAPAPQRERGMRIGTVVWGLVLAAIGAGILAWAIGVTFDVELAFIVLVAAAGVLLLVGSLATSLRRRR